MEVAPRALLASPPGLPTPVPLLNHLGLAAALRRSGVEVTVLDLARPAVASPAERLVAAVDRGRPTLLGLSLYTETALATYRLLDALGPREGLVRVAGGPHATAAPEEALARGFDLVVRGEGERALVAVARGEDRGPVVEYPRVEDLDDLASPTEALDLVPTGSTPAILTSRGCPSRCTFCANQVHGRRLRVHSLARVLAEVRAWQDWGSTASLFVCDAAFTARRAWTLALCEALAALPLRPRWWCEARADQLDPALAGAMARAGCETVLVGAESGDPAVLSRVGKGLDTADIAAALAAIHGAGMRAEVSFMLGFPDESPRELDHTLGLMEQVAGHVHLFRPMGIVVPYPGTALYTASHAQLGFTDWWLDPARMDRLEASKASLGAPRTPGGLLEMHARAEEALLDLGLIPHSPEVRRAVDRCRAFRREHNRSSLALDATQE